METTNIRVNKRTKQPKLFRFELLWNSSISNMTKPPLTTHASPIDINGVGLSVVPPLRETVATHPSPQTTSTPITTTPQATHDKPPKKKRIRFPHVWDILLLKAVTAVDGHRTQHGQLRAKYEEALQVFLTSAPEVDTMISPTWKSLAIDSRRSRRTSVLQFGTTQPHQGSSKLRVRGSCCWMMSCMR